MRRVTNGKQEEEKVNSSTRQPETSLTERERRAKRNGNKSESKKRGEGKGADDVATKLKKSQQKGYEEELLATKLKREAKAKRKRERFVRSRMWISTLISYFFTDRGTIPDNIGNNILVTNNLYITKNHLSAIIHVIEMSEATPIAWTSELIKMVKDQTEGVIVDITFKGQRYRPDITPSAISSKEKTWHQTLDNPFMPEVYVRRAARCLYTLDVARSGVYMYKERVYITIRATNGTMLKRGINVASSYLSSIGAKYTRINSNIEEHLQYLTLMCDKKPAHLKDVAPVIFSTQTLAESLPVLQGANDEAGQLMGYDVVSGYPYFINFKATAAAKNIMVEALSGWGKTFMAEFWLYPFYADGFNLSLMDIKGNEFSAVTEALNGVHLSMRPTSTRYINTFKWYPEEVVDDYRTYANERFRMSKERMLCICDLPEKLTSQAEALLEEFLQYVYVRVGASVENVNTWSRTNVLNPYVIFDMFEKYVSNELRVKYADVITKMLERLRIYMSRKGSKSHIYRDEYSYLEVLETKCLTFDFGILETSTSNDPVMFHLHVMDMIAVNDAYVSYKKKHGEWTLKVLEESQIVDDWLTKVYTREITLRRSQNQCTLLLGNSVAALAANPLSAPIIENINILCLGSLNLSSRKFLQEEFGLKPRELETLEQIQTDPDMQRRFLLVNRMEPNATTAILEANVPYDVSQSRLFKVVDTEENQEVR